MDLVNMSDADIKEVFESHPNLVATFRPGRVGEQERTRQLMLALECGAAWVDIEFEAPNEWKKEMVDFAHKLKKGDYQQPQLRGNAFGWGIRYPVRQYAERWCRP